MEFRKTALMNLCSGQQWRHKQRTDLQTQQLGEEGEGGGNERVTWKQIHYQM